MIFRNTELAAVASHAVGEFAITAKVKLLRQEKEFWLTTVYGLEDGTRHDEFLVEISSTVCYL